MGVTDTHKMIDVFCDFETRSHVDLRRCGSHHYSRDSSTEVLCMAYAFGNGDVRLWVRGEPFPEGLREAIVQGCLFHAWNAAFEYVIWNNIMVPRHGWEPIPIEQWRCTMAKSSYSNHPRGLEAAALRLLPEEFHKDGEGRKLMLKMCKPNRKGKWLEDTESLNRLYDYCKQDVVVERAMDKVLHPWPDSEIEIWQVNEHINETGVPLDRELCVGAVHVLDYTLDRLSKRILKLTNGEIETGDQIARIKKFIAERGINMACLDAECVEDALAQTIPDEIRDVLMLRQVTAGKAAKKYHSALNVMDDDSRARGLFMYYNASTGRFASVKTQFQNMKKGGNTSGVFSAAVSIADVDMMQVLYGDNMIGVLGDHVRNMVRAMPGHVLIRADESQIECRVLHWLARNESKLDTFRLGADPYIELAEKIFKRKNIQKDDEERDVSKVAELGLGFGMGHVRFISQAKSKAGITLNAKLARRIVLLYRKENPEVLHLWETYQVAAIACVEHGTTVRVGHVVFRKEGEYLTVTLPSGRRLFYYKPKFELGSRGPRFVYYNNRSIRYEWAGGLLTENIVQAVARDILTNAMVLAYKAGLPICMHVHDELILEVPEYEVEESSRLLYECMVTVPSWAVGLPLAAELKVVPCYA